MIDEALLRRLTEALKKYFLSCSTQLGSDCYTLCALGAQILADEGYSAKVHVGEAGWRLGESENDVISHLYSGPPVDSGPLGYHAWIVCSGYYYDPSIWQLPLKAKQMDEIDGYQTNILWGAPYLYGPIKSYGSLNALRQSNVPGTVYYKRIPKLEKHIASLHELDEIDLNNLRRVYQLNPAKVFGPNDFPTDGIANAH